MTAAGRTATAWTFQFDGTLLRIAMNAQRPVSTRPPTPAWWVYDADESAAARAGFDEFRARFTRQLGLAASAILAVGTLFWWPLDRFVLPYPGDTEGFARLRFLTLVLAGGVAATFLRSGRSWRWTCSASMIWILSFQATIGWCVGSVPGGWVDGGVPTRLLWLADAWLAIIPVALLPISLTTRIWFTSLSAVCMAMAFVLGSGGAPGAGLPSQLSFALFSTVVSVSIGELTFRLIRRTFMERTELALARQQLETLAGSLQHQVQERTAELRHLAEHLGQVQEHERRRIAHDLHDDLGQQLTALKFSIDRLDGLLAQRQVEDAQDVLEDMTSGLQQTFASTRAAVAGLRPRVLDDLGLLPALEWLCDETRRSSGLPCDLKVAMQHRLIRTRPDVELLLFRLAQECITNALKHADPSLITLTLDVKEESPDVVVTLEIVDDGIGLPTGDARPNGRRGFGLLGLRERLRSAGGQLTVHAGEPRGTRVRGSLTIVDDTSSTEVAT